jgi:hypothetical protein
MRFESASAAALGPGPGYTTGPAAPGSPSYPGGGGAAAVPSPTIGPPGVVPTKNPTPGEWLDAGGSALNWVGAGFQKLGGQKALWLNSRASATQVGTIAGHASNAIGLGHGLYQAGHGDLRNGFSNIFSSVANFFGGLFGPAAGLAGGAVGGCAGAFWGEIGEGTAKQFSDPILIELGGDP